MSKVILKVGPFWAEMKNLLVWATDPEYYKKSVLHFRIKSPLFHSSNKKTVLYNLS